MVRDPSPTTEYTPQQTPRVVLREATYEEYLATAPDSLISEWADGEMITYMPPLTPHATLIEFLVQLLGLFIKVSKLGRLMVAPFEVKLERSSREPDIAFIHNDNLHRLDGKRFTGPPDLVIEVVSTESAHRDRVDKFDEYEAAEVKEYWILDNRPNRNRAQFYQLGQDGRYHEAEPDAQGIYRSRELPGLWVNVSWLWQDAPDALRAIAQVIGPERVAEALRKAAE
jgi:Uma2 family endonuclease